MREEEELKSELRSEVSYLELLKIAKKRGLQREPRSQERIIDWLLQDGLTWREYELNYNPYIALKLRICKFFGIKKGWKIMDIGCGSGGTSATAASLVGSGGKVLAIDKSEEEIRRCNNYIRKVRFEEIIETKVANIFDLQLEGDHFDIVLLLYSPQFLGYFGDLREVLLRIRKWTARVGIADHVPVPGKHDESIYILYNWLNNDVARLSAGDKTDRLFHPEEIRNALSTTGWDIVRERRFKVSKKNVWPEWAMKDNIERLSRQIETLKDPVHKEILSSRLQTIEKLTQKQLMPKPTSMFAALAEAR